MTTIEAIELRTILDSRGNPTVEAEIFTTGGFWPGSSPERCKHRRGGSKSPAPKSGNRQCYPEPDPGAGRDGRI